MGYKGRLYAVGIVILFNILRYYYYHQYLGYSFKASFFVLTAVFLLIAWFGGKQYDLARFYAERDPLTNVYNRLTIEKAFKKQASLCRSRGGKLAVALIDINDFKEINDKHGHQKGDEVLQFVAGLLLANAKKGNLVVRWGGDEFIHLISNVEPECQAAYIQNITKQLSHLTMEPLSPLSASIGFAVYPDDGDSFERLIQRADESMYEMKVDEKTKRPVKHD
ncbi:GGDEF domain-containing protein [Sporosarcina sp. P33]|uniref:GGDEF domain-containing protein n=1 Tax=Sporosarcina sp. P33 TaxID=1930764 RepID=UPI0009BE3415|nr:GGDEF domain-containing protein [Sporosarcina sp. P33]ARD47925.1 hypothetical protein SporoP33_06595 [Sporosarcina sp. P33]